MISLRILMLDIESELQAFITSELKIIDSFSLLDITLLTDTLDQYSIHQQFEFDLIIFDNNTSTFLKNYFSSVKSSYLNTKRIIQVNEDASYTEVRNSFFEGAYDYWIKPYNYELIKSTLTKVVSEVYFKISVTNAKRNIQNAITGKSALLNHDLKVFFHENIPPSISQSHQSLNLYVALLDLLSDISFNPMPLEKSTIADICSTWISKHDHQFLAFQECIKKITSIYQEIFIPNVQTIIVRKAIFEVLSPSTHIKTVSYVAKKLYINQSHLSMTFKRQTNISLSEYIKKIKIYGAMLMLLDQNYSIDDILNILGYKDEQHFSRIFKTYTGTLPISYRQLNHRLLKQKSTQKGIPLD
ncbi:helix-turn-helix transcriptional regulator [Fusibacter bizertensis]|uniref:Helix-turn-helix transcriptional regulator n=1 Tax=Fusibacter bizertensis TaxID=1488331 RepID=A0ABT6NGW6_9FIRM|nr:response regulator transcription factor [Fusibacter bizertensis]MDH8679585.1 helix-turn-helix transcriptional regulator [Fusibacter bizertensis]